MYVICHWYQFGKYDCEENVIIGTIYQKIQFIIYHQS